MNGDGKPDLVSARMDVYQPFTNDGRVVLWLNHWGQGSPKTGRSYPESLGLYSIAGLSRRVAYPTW